MHGTVELMHFLHSPLILKGYTWYPKTRINDFWLGEANIYRLCLLKSLLQTKHLGYDTVCAVHGHFVMSILLSHLFFQDTAAPLYSCWVSVCHEKKDMYIINKIYKQRKQFYDVYAFHESINHYWNNINMCLCFWLHCVPKRQSVKRLTLSRLFRLPATGIFLQHVPSRGEQVG